MARGKNKLSAVAVKSAPAGKLQDGGGLFLDKGETGGKWIYRYTIAGRRRDMGLGTYPHVSLAAARADRDKWAAVLQSGSDPISERERRLEAERAELSREDPTLAELIDIVFESKKATLRGDGERGRWMSPLRLHVLPKLGNRRASKIHQTDIRDVLAPIWRKKHETAQKAIGRLAIAFTKGKLSGYQVDPFTVEAAKHMLGAVHQVTKPIEATPWQDIPALFARLGAKPTTSHLCLQLIILTALRGDAARGARIEEIEGDVWTVPADRVKGRLGQVGPFRVPLSQAALEVIEQCRPGVRDGFLFPSTKHNGSVGPISSTSIEKAMNVLNETGRPHGFRTSFRTWVQDTQAATYDVAETALGHIIGGKVERSYARSDLLDQRRILMDKWAYFVTAQEAKVVQLRRG